MIKRERDPNILKLEKDVFAQLRSLLPQDPVLPPQSALATPKSVEDAIKELIEMEKAFSIPK
jgi:hypothetical protein